MTPRTLGLALGFLGLSLLSLSSGCAPHYDHLDYTNVVKGPARVEIEPHSFLLADGMAVSLTPKAKNDDDTFSKEDVVLQSDNPHILQVLPGPDPGSFVLIATSVGRTSVRVLVGGDLNETIPASVVIQENAGL